MLTEDPSVKTIMHRVKEGNLSHAAEWRCPGFLFLFLFLFLSEFFLSHCICPQSLLRLRSPSGRPDPACRSPAIGAVFPCCKAQSIPLILSARQASWRNLSDTRLRV